MRVSENVEEDYMNEEEAKRTALMITGVLDRLGIDYWFDYGALLGTIRGQAFIPWDTDIEINFRYTNQNTIKKLVMYLKLFYNIESEIKEYYISIERQHGYVGMSLSWFPENPVTMMLSKVCYYLPSVIRRSIIKATQELYSKSTNEFIRPDDGEDRENSFHCRLIRQFLPIFFCGKTRDAELYDFKVKVPGKAEELLIMRYGEDWRTPMQKYRSYTT